MEEVIFLRAKVAAMRQQMAKMFGNQFNFNGGYNYFDCHSEESNRAERDNTWNTHTSNSLHWTTQYQPQPEFQWNYQHENQYTPQTSYNSHNFWQNQNQYPQPHPSSFVPREKTLEEMFEDPLERQEKWEKKTDEGIAKAENHQREIEVNMQN